MAKNKSASDKMIMQSEGPTCACEGKNLVRFIQPVLLSFLSEKPTHGYALLGKLEDIRMIGKEPPDPSGVYRSLRDMEKKGLITSKIVCGESVGLGRKVYALTEEGVHCKANWLSTLTAYRDDLLEVIELLEKSM